MLAGGPGGLLSGLLELDDAEDERDVEDGAKSGRRLTMDAGIFGRALEGGFSLRERAGTRSLNETDIPPTKHETHLKHG